jgi:two-component system phosphate regulon sensor histidine kinase PhoR
LAVLFLVSLLLYQAKELYNRTLYELNAHIENTLSTATIRHEKADDFKRYTDFFKADLGTQYKKALKQEFQNIAPVEESVSIRDTFILIDGVDVKYLYITGESYDSITDVKAKHSVLARDLSELSDFRDIVKSNDQSTSSDPNSFDYELDKRVITNLFRKSKYVNDLMINTFRSSDFLEASKRIDLLFLDSIIGMTFRSEDLAQNYNFMITDEFGKRVDFDQDIERYNKDLDTTNTFRANLFPGNIFDEPLTIYLEFPKKGAALLSEMWLTLLISVFLIVLIVISFAIMFRTIVNQRKLAEIKNDFISNMTHEFKTPISTISLACEAMSDDDMLANQHYQVISPYVGMIVDENKRLSSLVERILQSAILDKGQLKLKNEKLELNEIVDTAVQKARIRIPKGKGEIKLDLDLKEMPFYGDEVHTINLVSNLIDNAIKYSKEEISITVKTRAVKKAYHLEVADKGIGIKQEHLDKIFDKLYRVPTGNVHDVKGFGLGLSYVKAITLMKGWDIKVKSKLGEGSTFILIINKEDKDE